MENLCQMIEHRWEQAQPNELKEWARLLEAQLKTHPTSQAYGQLGQIYQRLIRPHQAYQVFLKQAQLEPLNPEVHATLGALALALEEWALAHGHFRQYSQLNPQETLPLEHRLFLMAYETPEALIPALNALQEQIPLLESLASLLEHLGHFNEALAVYRLLSERVPENLFFQIKSVLLPPLIPKSPAAIAQFWETVMQVLTSLPALEEPPDSSRAWQQLEDIMKYCDYTSYLYPRPLQFRQEIHRLLFSHTSEVLAFPPRARPKMGFLMSPSNAALYFFMGYLQHMDTTLFDAVLISTHADLPEAFQAPSGFKTLILDPNPEQSRQQVMQLQLDLLYISEAHAGQFLQTYLAHHRLAPVQVTSILSSGSTGSPHIDAYLTSKDLEPSSAQKHYTEQLHFLSHFPAFTRFPESVDIPQWGREDFGLPEGGAMYLCPHMLLKYHPDFDAMILGVLKADPHAQIVCLQNPESEALLQRLISRFEAQLGLENMRRVWFLPRLTRGQLLRLFQLGDVILDPPYFGMGTTAFEALAMGIPCVSLPGQTLHGRVVHYIHNMTGTDTSCTATDLADYICKAVALTRGELGTEIKQALLSRGRDLFENHAAVRELERWLLHQLQ